MKVVLSLVTLHDKAVREVKSSLKSFFLHFPESFSTITVRGGKLGKGCDQSSLIKLDTTTVLTGVGVPVKIFTNGTQCFVTSVTIDGWSNEKIKQVIENGPYKQKPKKEEDITATSDVVCASSIEKEVVVGEQPLATNDIPTVVDKPAIKRSVMKLTALERLKKSNVPEEEIERLRATLASIVTLEMDLLGIKEVPKSLDVPVTRITQAIMDHMKLPHNAAGNFRGTVASFYVSRIALFALKYDVYENSEELYTPWLFDVDAVMDFVGGENRMVALTIERRQEVAERAQELPKQEVPVSASPLEEAIKTDFVSEASVLNLAAKTIEARLMAEKELHLAEANELAQLQIVQDLRSKLEVAEADLSTAKALTRQAKERVAGLTISDETMKRIREIKQMLDMLSSKLDI